MEFEIKNLDFETLVKQLDNFLDMFSEHLDNQNTLFIRLDRISKALETIAQEMVVENETL